MLALLSTNAALSCVALSSRFADGGAPSVRVKLPVPSPASGKPPWSVTETYAVAASVGQEVATWLIRTVSALTASDVPEIGKPNVGDVGSFDTICTFAAEVPAPVGRNATRNVHDPPGATVGV